MNADPAPRPAAPRPVEPPPPAPIDTEEGLSGIYVPGAPTVSRAGPVPPPVPDAARLAPAYPAYAAPPQPPPTAPPRVQPQPRSRGKRYVLPVVGGLIVLATIAAVGAWFVNIRAGAQATTAAVQRFADALSSGDGSAATAMLAAPPADATWLSSDVLRRAREIAPLRIDGIAPGASASERVLSYRVGDDSGQAVIETVRDGGDIKIGAGATTKLRFSDESVQQGLRLAGAPVQPEVEVFFGAYPLESAEPYFAAEPAVIRASGAEATPDVALALSEEGKQAVVDSWRNMIATCTGQAELSPAGCPFGFDLQEGWTVDERSIEWQLAGDPFADLDPALSDGTVATAEVTLALRLRATYDAGGRSSTRTDTQTVRLKLTADVAENPLRPSWSK